MSIIIYSNADGRYPALYDSSGANITTKKELWPGAFIGSKVEVINRPVHNGFVPFTLAELQAFASFDVGLDTDWDTSEESPPPVRTTTGFVVEEVTEITVEADEELAIEEESITWAQIRYNMDLGTDEVIGKLGTQEYLAFGGEIDGFVAGEERPPFVSLFPFLVLGRRLAAGTGTPNPVDDGTLAASQIYALLADEADEDFSGYDTKAELVEADTILANNSEDSGNIIVVTLAKIWTFISATLFPGSMTIGHLTKYGTGGTLVDAGVAATDLANLPTTDQKAALTASASPGTGNAYVVASDITGFALTVHSHIVSDVTGLQGALDAKADLVDGTIPTSQLPSYVDDVVEVADFASLPGTGEAGKIYVTLDDNKTYRWSGSAYTEISASLALGETSGTAYRGDRGKTAYDHSQNITTNPHNVTPSQVGNDTAQWNANKIQGKTLDIAARADQYAIVYDLASDTHIYVAMSSGTGGSASDSDIIFFSKHYSSKV